MGKGFFLLGTFSSEGGCQMSVYDLILSLDIENLNLTKIILSWQAWVVRTVLFQGDNCIWTSQHEKIKVIQMRFLPVGLPLVRPVGSRLEERQPSLILEFFDTAVTASSKIHNKMKLLLM